MFATKPGGLKLEMSIDPNAVWIADSSTFGMIRPGDKLEMRLLNDDANQAMYKSKVADVPNIGGGIRAISIFAPSIGDKMLNMQVGDEYELVIQTKEYLTRFTGSFEGYMKEQANYFAVIKILDEGIKLQRREFFRFTCMLAMKFSVMYTGDNEAAKLLQNSGYSAMANGIIRDIGGGGIRFITNQDLEEGSMIQSTIMLGHTAMLIKGRILDKQFMPKSNMQFQYRAIFMDVSQATQDEIVNFIFQEQRKQKKMKQVPTK